MISSEGYQNRVRNVVGDEVGLRIAQNQVLADDSVFHFFWQCREIGERDPQGPWEAALPPGISRSLSTVRQLVHRRFEICVQPLDRPRLLVVAKAACGSCPESPA